MDERELYRGKRADNGKWVKGYLLGQNRDVLYCENRRHDEMLDEIKVQQETIGQFTGYKDKNRIEICEGDVVLDCGKEFNGVTTVVDKKFLNTYNCTSTYAHDAPYWEVIGNIHDNPELLVNPKAQEQKQSNTTQEKNASQAAEKEKQMQTDNVFSPESFANLKDENTQLRVENNNLKGTVKKLSEVIDRTNAILKESPPLLNAFKQEKEKYMSKHNINQEQHIDKAVQKNKPMMHNKR